MENSCDVMPNYATMRRSSHSLQSTIRLSKPLSPISLPMLRSIVISLILHSSILQLSLVTARSATYFTTATLCDARLSPQHATLISYENATISYYVIPTSMSSTHNAKLQYNSNVVDSLPLQVLPLFFLAHDETKTVSSHVCTDEVHAPNNFYHAYHDISNVINATTLETAHHIFSNQQSVGASNVKCIISSTQTDCTCKKIATTSVSILRGGGKEVLEDDAFDAEENTWSMREGGEIEEGSMPSTIYGVKRSEEKFGTKNRRRRGQGKKHTKSQSNEEITSNLSERNNQSWIPGNRIWNSARHWIDRTAEKILRRSQQRELHTTSNIHQENDFESTYNELDDILEKKNDMIENSDDLIPDSEEYQLSQIIDGEDWLANSPPAPEETSLLTGRKRRALRSWLYKVRINTDDSM